MENVELLIVGAGPTGLFATLCAGLRDINSVTLEGMDTYGGQMSELYPEKIVYDVQGVPKASASAIAKNMYEQAQIFKKPIIFSANVTDIVQNPDKTFNIEVNGKLAYNTKAILICSGVGYFVPNKLNVDGEDTYQDSGVSYAVKSTLEFKDKNVVIVGGGDSAFDYAMQLEPVAKSVTIIQHNNILKAADSSIKDARSKPKIKILLNTDIVKIVGDGKEVTSLRLRDASSKTESDMVAESVVVAIGHKAAVNAFKSLHVNTDNRYIMVDSSYRTNIEGVYAAGDVARSGTEPKFALITVGGAEAYIAINNIKKYVSPGSSLFGGHSSALNL